MPLAPASVEECELPRQSVLHPEFVHRAYFHDSYRASLANRNSSVVDVFLAIFGHHPAWMKAVLVVRNFLASLGGLEAPTASEIMSPKIKSSYSVGDKIGVWPIFALSGTELVAGRDNKHLDFRLSIMRTTSDETASVVVSTVCRVHNLFGKVYLFFIVPFHRWGVRWLIHAAAAAGRL